MLGRSNRMCSSLLSGRGDQIPVSLIGSLCRVGSRSCITSILLIIKGCGRIGSCFGECFDVSSVSGHVSLLCRVNLSCIIVGRGFTRLRGVRGGRFMLFRSFASACFRGRGPTRRLGTGMLRKGVLCSDMCGCRLSLVPRAIRRRRCRSVSIAYPSGAGIITGCSKSRCHGAFIVSGSSVRLGGVIGGSTVNRLL